MITTRTLTGIMLSNMFIRFCKRLFTFLTMLSFTSHLHSFLQEADKIREEESKNKSTYNTKRSYGDLLMIVISKAISKGAKLDVTTVLSHILDYFNSFVLKRYFSVAYLTVLKDILSVQRHYGLIECDEWIGTMFNKLQTPK